MADPVIYFTSDSFSPNGSAASLKFDLSLKTREAEQVAGFIKELQALPATERQAWLDSNGQTVDQALQMFADKATATLDGMQLDGETMTMTMELVKSLREVVSTLQGLNGVPDSQLS